MAEKFQTQCPHCGVKFQISSQQLSLANGNVRCGSCLQVFQASSSLVPLTGGTAPSGVGSARAPSAAPSARPPAAPPRAPARPAAPVAATPRATPPLPPPGPEESDDDLADMILRELENPEPAPPPRAAAPVPPAPARAPAPPARTPAPKAPPVTPAESSIDDDSDDLADMILRELENPEPVPPPKAARPATPPPQAPQAPQAPQWTPPPQAQRPPEPQWSGPAAASPPPGNRFGIEDNKTKVSLGKGHEQNLIDDSRIEDSRTTNRIVTDDDVDIFGGGANTLLDDIEEPVDESWAKELLGEKVENEKDALVRRFTEIKADNLSLAATTGVQQKSALQDRLARLDRREADDTLQPLSRTGSAGSVSAGLDTDPDDLDFLNDGGLTMQDVDIHPVDHNSTEFDTAGMAHQVEWGRETFWGALSAVFALLLLGQYLVFNFDSLSRDDSWRGLYEVACGAIGCELPGESDIGRIQGANLVVRSHPSAAGALIIDAIVYNRAPFAQPFPDLELSFSDRSGKLLAGRVFKPEEYLQGELAGSESMPPDTPVHLSLELVDPGTEAVNYELRFLPPTTSS